MGRHGCRFMSKFGAIDMVRCCFLEIWGNIRENIYLAFFHEVHVFLHEFSVFSMSLIFFYPELPWVVCFFHVLHEFRVWISCFFSMNFIFLNEFHVFFMNTAFFFLGVSHVSHVFVQARGFEPQRQENMGNLVLVHILGRCIPRLQLRLVKKRVFKIIFLNFNFF